MGWEKYAPVEGFEALDRWQGEVTGAVFKGGDYGTQLDLTCRVDAVEAPPDASPQEEYHCWYAIGPKASQKWQIVNNGLNIWSQDDEANWTTSSKFGKLVQKCMDLNAPIVNSGMPPTDARAWVGLKAVFERTSETVTIRGQTDPRESSITLPVQILNAAVAVSASNGSSAVPPPPPGMAIPAAVDFTARWGSNADAWKAYLRRVCSGKSLEAAKQAIIADDNCKKDSVLTAAAENESFFAWAEKDNFMKVVDGVLV